MERYRFQRWLSVTECFKDLQADGIAISYWRLWVWVRRHCQWEKVGREVVISEQEWRTFKERLKNGWRPPNLKQLRRQPH